MLSDRKCHSLYDCFHPSNAHQMARMLRMLTAATSLDDQRVPPGNRLEKLAGDRAGQWSVRVNAQWRVSFVWREGDAHDVKLVDDHS